jgi:hypothetical protein
MRPFAWKAQQHRSQSTKPGPYFSDAHCISAAAMPARFAGLGSRYWGVRRSPARRTDRRLVTLVVTRTIVTCRIHRACAEDPRCRGRDQLPARARAAGLSVIGVPWTTETMSKSKAGSRTREGRAGEPQWRLPSGSDEKANRRRGPRSSGQCRRTGIPSRRPRHRRSMHAVALRPTSGEGVPGAVQHLDDCQCIARR